MFKGRTVKLRWGIPFEGLQMFMYITYALKVTRKNGQGCVSLPSRQLSVGCLKPQEREFLFEDFGNLWTLEGRADPNVLNTSRHLEKTTSSVVIFF